MNITLSTQTLVIILVAILVIACASTAISRSPARRRGRRIPTTRPKGPQRVKSAYPRSRDKGAEVARRYGRSRSPEWPRVAHEHLAIEPACVVCGHRGQGLQVHHIKPFHLFPQLELDPKNLITLCEIKGRDHHLLVGHLDDWESYNVNVRTDVKRFHKENAIQIRAEPAWIKEVLHRPMP